MKQTGLWILVAACVASGACDLPIFNRSSSSTTGSAPSIPGLSNCDGRECGGSCGTCPAGFGCDGQGHCAIQASAWSVTVVGATIVATNSSGASWDPDGGSPDPKVCATVGTATQPACSARVMETLQPVWNFNVGSFGVEEILRGITFNVSDVDDLVDDTIGACRFVPDGTSRFREGTFVFPCQGAQLTIRLAPL